MRAAVLAVALILAACGGFAPPQARSSFQASARPTTIAVTPTPTPTPSPAPTPAAGSKLKWAAPMWIDHEPALASNSIQGVSCPNVSFCAAVDDNGNVVTSSNPSGGAAAWTVTHVDGSNSISAVSCPSSGLCVAVDSIGNVVTSGNPAGGTAAWTLAHISRGLVDVACPSTDLCVAVDRDGNIATSSNPTSGAEGWKLFRIAGTKPLGVSCSSIQFCVAVDDRGNVITSSNPTGGAPAWKVNHLDTGPAGFNTRLVGVSCFLWRFWLIGATLCVARSDDGYVVTSSDPTGGAAPCADGEADDRKAVPPPCEVPSPAWQFAPIVDSVVQGASCPRIDFCVAVDDQGNVVTSNNPTGGSAAWTRTHVGGDCTNPEKWTSCLLNGLSCPSSALCVAVDSDGNVVTSSDPTGGPAAWTVTNVDSVRLSTVDSSNALIGISCPDTNLCVAVDGNGNIVTSSNPSGGTAAWTVTSVDGATPIYSVSCPSVNLCVGLGEGANVVTSRNPTGGASAWTVTNLETDTYLISVSCPSTHLCVAVDDIGNVAISRNPAGGPRGRPATWTFTGGAAPGIMSCPTISFCVAADFDGGVVTSNNPTGGQAAWRLTRMKGAYRIYDLSCASASLCVAVEGEAPASDSPVDLNSPTSGNVVASSNPTGGAWTVTNVDGSNFLHGVSCPSFQMCVAVDNVGNVITSSKPTGGKAAWRVTNVDGRNSLSGVSCPSSTFCVAVDDMGNVIIGTAQL